jgi:uncharacterized membrane protein HdeD (DUF308 family)
MLFLLPNAGIVVLVWIVAIYALLYGAALVGVAAVLRGHIDSDQAMRASERPAS